MSYLYGSLSRVRECPEPLRRLSRCISTSWAKLADKKSTDEAVSKVKERAIFSHEDDPKEAPNADPASDTHHGDKAILPGVKEEESFPQQSKKERGSKDQDHQEAQAPTHISKEGQASEDDVRQT
ncbi:hypothetical protein WJX73_006551 [Symbiochloris irregularis]|uniref:Uncharacterized protein n=1 Tax=Symbiochloris irregularis TaxID=706552 RepID=A0AAW1NMS1_9CHLO